MKETHSDLHELLSADKYAHAYFMQQPEYVQGAIVEKASDIRSLRALEEAVRAVRHSVL